MWCADYTCQKAELKRSWVVLKKKKNRINRAPDLIVACQQSSCRISSHYGNTMDKQLVIPHCHTCSCQGVHTAGLPSAKQLIFSLHLVTTAAFCGYPGLNNSNIFHSRWNWWPTSGCMVIWSLCFLTQIENNSHFPVMLGFQWCLQVTHLSLSVPHAGLFGPESVQIKWTCYQQWQPYKHLLNCKLYQELFHAFYPVFTVVLWNRYKYLLHLTELGKRYLMRYPLFWEWQVNKGERRVGKVAGCQIVHEWPLFLFYVFYKCNSSWSCVVAW